MSRLLIAGAGGCGREVLQWAMDINEIEHRWDSYGFLDTDAHALDGKVCRAEVIGEEDSVDILDDDEFVVAVGDGELRSRVSEKLIKRGAKPATLIHPSAEVAYSAKIEKGCIVYPYSVVSADTHVGVGCLINTHSAIGHDVNIGKYSTIGPNSCVSGMCVIGCRVYLGTGVNIVPSVKVGDDAFICAGSTVLTRVKSGTKVFGNPATRMDM